MFNGKSWKTTSAGVLSIIAGVLGLYFTFKAGLVDPSAVTAAILASAGMVLNGIGNLFSKDSNVTGAGDNAATVTGTGISTTMKKAGE